MAITNGYTTLAELKERLLDVVTYTAATISFTSATKRVSDTAYGLKLFQTGDVIQISGSTSNNGFFNITTGNLPGYLVTTEALTDEVAGDTVTIVQVVDIPQDNVLEDVVTGVSRMIDAYCRTRFYTTTSDETRYFTAEFDDILWIGEYLSVTTLKTDPDGDRTYDITWTASDYDKMPFNATLDGRPYTSLEITPEGDYGFPEGVSKGVQVVGKWGHSSTTPAVVQQACLLQSARIVKRKDAVFGVMGGPAIGYVRLQADLDPDVKQMLEGVRRLGIGA